MDVNGEETYKFDSTVVGGAIPKEYIPAVGEGIEEAMKAGILGGFPVVGIHATVYDGSYHEVDSSEMAFHIAGSLAFKDAMKKSDPVLLEPIMKLKLLCRKSTWEMLSVISTPVVDVSKVWMTSAVERSLEDMFRFQKCSDTLQTFVPELRDVETTQCSSKNMSQFRSLYRKRFYLTKTHKKYEKGFEKLYFMKYNQY